ncbi:MAG: amidohydrolase [Chloroflexi bacterium]|nr:amidohydrolase [Chloroflexota bacterium]
MIIDAHSHPYDPEALKARLARPGYQATAYTIERRVMDGRLRTEYWDGGITVERNLAEMDEAGIDKTFLLNSFITRTQGGGRVPNQAVYDLYLRPHPDRFVGFAGCDPIAPEGTFNQAGLEEYKRAIGDLRFTGMKLLPTYGHYSPNDPRIYPYYALAVELGTPIVMHQGMTPVRTTPAELARPYLLDRVLLDFPTLRLSVAHMGEPWEDELLGLMLKHRHLYTDISYLCELGLERVARNLATARGFGVLDRVMFGTDSGCRPPKCYVDWLKTGLNETVARLGYQPFTADQIRGILGANAERFLRRP